jgi:hypothetical protein
MRTFIQLRDGIGFASLVTPNGEPDYSVTPDHTTAIEVFTDNPDQFLGKQYNAETKSWSDAPLIRYAELNENGVPIEIRRTFFAHTIPSNAAIMPDEADATWQVIDGQWVAPVIYVDSQVIQPEPQIMIEDIQPEPEAVAEDIQTEAVVEDIQAEPEVVIE